MPSYVPCGAYVPCRPNQQYGAQGFTTYSFPMVASGSFGPLGDPPHFSPGMDEDNISSTMELGGGYRLEFRAWAVASSGSLGVIVDGRIAIRLLDSSGSTALLISEISSSSPNSPASAVPWVATTVETRLKEVGLDVAPPDLELLEAASNKVYGDSLLHCVSAFASFFVSRVSYQEASDAWRNATIRYVMSS